MAIEVQNFTSKNIQDFHTDGSVKLWPQDSVIMTNDGGDSFAFGDDSRLRIGSETMLFADPVEGAAVNTNLWTNNTSTMTISQATAQITMNANSTLTASAYAILISNKVFWRMTEFPLYGQAIVKIVANPNAVMEFGFGSFATTVSPVTDGVFIRVTSGGQYQVVQSFNSAEVVNTIVLASDGVTPWIPDATRFYICEITVREAIFNLDIQQIGTDGDTVSMQVPINYQRIAEISVNHINFGYRVYNQTTALVASQLIVGATNVQQMDLATYRPFGEQMAVNQRGSYQGPNTTAGFTGTANHANSTSPTSATLSNTAAGYTTLGGRWQFVPVTGAATDYALFGYQVPTGYDLIITGLKISALIGTALGATAEVLDWSIGMNASAVSLATAESPPTSWATRRLPVGTQGFIASAAAGVAANDIVLTFPTPLIVNSARFLHIIVQIPNGTTTGLIRGDVMINGYYE